MDELDETIFETFKVLHEGASDDFFDGALVFYKWQIALLEELEVYK